MNIKYIIFLVEKKKYNNTWLDEVHLISIKKKCEYFTHVIIKVIIFSYIYNNFFPI